jgi:hypothetical protein
LRIENYTLFVEDQRIDSILNSQLKSPFRAVALGLEEAATLEYHHAHHEQEKGDAPPVDLFHNPGMFK